MKEYAPITQIYFDVTKDSIIFYCSAAPLNLRVVGEVTGMVPRLSNEAITWLNTHNITLNLELGMYCLEQPGNKLRILED